MRDNDAVQQILDDAPHSVETVTRLVISHLRLIRRRGCIATLAWIAASASLGTLLILAWMFLSAAGGFFSVSILAVPIAWTGVAASAQISRAAETTRWLASIRSVGLTPWAFDAQPLTGTRPVAPVQAITEALACAHRASRAN